MNQAADAFMGIFGFKRVKEKAMEKKPSLRKAINAYCKGCIYDDQSGLGNWRQQVTLCTVTSCELYQVRPQSKPDDRRSRAKTVPEQQVTGNG